MLMARPISVQRLHSIFAHDSGYAMLTARFVEFSKVL